MSLIDYIDPKKVTVSILRDWNDQHWKAEYGHEKVEEVVTRLNSVATSRLSRDVHSGTSDYNEALAVAVDKKTVAEYGHAKAKEYVHDIAACWERLTDDERYLLTARFIDRDERDGIGRIQSRYYISRTEAYNRSNAALDRLARLIFW